MEKKKQQSSRQWDNKINMVLLYECLFSLKITNSYLTCIDYLFYIYGTTVSVRTVSNQEYHKCKTSIEYSLTMGYISNINACCFAY